MNSTVSFYSSFSNNFVFFAVVLLLGYGAAFSINTTSLSSNAQLIPKEEVETLKVISHKLNIKFWRVSQGSCNDGGRSLSQTFAKEIFSNVTCDCSFNKSTVCHVTHIQLKRLNLSGVLPPEFGFLTELKELDLSRNYINGSIPTSLTKTPLVKLAIGSNRISGVIPEELGQISTLEELLLTENQLGGHLPESLGNLKQLKRLGLSANNFTGTIPATYVNLKNLTDFRIDGTTLSGKIPSFIGNWTEVKKLDLQGTNMEGPIPSAISSLKNLEELSVSDLKGSSTVISDLQLGELTKLIRLTLRNCLLTSSIPDIIGDIKNMKTLDLSFNSLTGTIPNNIQNYPLNYLFLSNNLLSGSIPDWIVSSRQSFDVSYNNFTGPISASCQQTNVNLVSCSSSTTGNSNTWCSEKDLRCPEKPQYYAMFINCGGSKVNYDGHEYEEDTTNMGSSYFSSKNSWAYSSTGVFDGNSNNPYTASNIYGLNVSGASYYQTARLSPVSLKYYGLCLRKGSYKVQLHFAEIMFSNNQGFSSLGKRIFDVAIQRSVKLKDFNIAEEAGGVGKNVTKVFEDVYVNGSTLEIHLYWAGKGTRMIPNLGVYGPLISAITVTPNFRTDEALLSVGVIVGIVLASIAVLLGILVILRLNGCLGGTVNEQREFLGLGTGYFSIRQIKAATDDFDPKNKIGEGGFGPVYKGVLPDGRVIAVKQLSSKSKQGNREFLNEIGMISALQHPNLVKLYGCCIEKKELLLVYEYMENNCLGRALFGCPEHRLNLDWPTRKNICLGIARGITYLHTESRLKIVHRDIKASNVLLDKNLTAKISDFGLAKLDDEENSHISTRVAGTIGYMAPEYAMRGYLTDKADVYSYGVVVLEIISGKSNTNYRPKAEFVYLLDWAYVLQERGNLLELVDPCLGANHSEEEAMRLLNLSLLCTNPSPTLRPSMSLVVSMIEGSAPVQVPNIDFNERKDDDLRFRAFEVMSLNGRSAHGDSSSASITRVQRSSSSASTMGPSIDTSLSIKGKDEAKDETPSSRLLDELDDV